MLANGSPTEKRFAARGKSLLLDHNPFPEVIISHIPDSLFLHKLISQPVSIPASTPQRRHSAVNSPRKALTTPELCSTMTARASRESSNILVR
jgi:hypothetical protein